MPIYQSPPVQAEQYTLLNAPIKVYGSPIMYMWWDGFTCYGEAKDGQVYAFRVTPYCTVPNILQVDLAKREVRLAMGVYDDPQVIFIYGECGHSIVDYFHAAKALTSISLDRVNGRRCVTLKLEQDEIGVYADEGDWTAATKIGLYHLFPPLKHFAPDMAITWTEELLINHLKRNLKNDY